MEDLENRSNKIQNMVPVYTLIFSGVCTSLFMIISIAAMYVAKCYSML